MSEEKQQGRTVLFIDDDSSIVALARIALERAGYEVLSAMEGGEALEVFADSHESLDAIVLDLRLPDMDGTELIGRLTETDDTVPIIVLSGGDPEALSAALDAGAVECLRKPFDVSGLSQRLERVISASSA